MKFLGLGAFVVAQIAFAAQPAMAADLPREASSGPNHVATFVGARIRVPLGATKEKPRAGLAFTATQRSGDTGTLRFSKGMELGFAGDDKVRLSVGGKPVSQLTQGGATPDGRKLGVSTLGWIGIGVGVVVIGTAVWFYAAITDDDRCCE
ncbi:MAG TPA: hypothetical protein VFZ91_02560 [Allosphingosinicella sp.]